MFMPKIDIQASEWECVVIMPDRLLSHRLDMVSNTRNADCLCIALDQWPS